MYSKSGVCLPLQCSLFSHRFFRTPCFRDRQRFSLSTAYQRSQGSVRDVEFVSQRRNTTGELLSKRAYTDLWDQESETSPNS